MSRLMNIDTHYMHNNTFNYDVVHKIHRLKKIVK